MIFSRHKLWLAVLFPFLTTPSVGSSVAIVVTDTAVMIAADGVLSKTTYGIRSSEKYCKIRKEGATFYTAVGTYGIPDLHFDVWTLASDAIQRSKTAVGIYDAVEPAILAKLPDVVQRSKIIDRANYDRWLTGIPVIAISFASFDRDVPIVATVTFTIDSTGEVLPPTRNTQHGTPGTAQNALLGYNDKMRLATASPTWGVQFLKDPTGFLQDMIQAEIDVANQEKRYDVGTPISILKLTKAGGAFEPGHEGACP